MSDLRTQGYALVGDIGGTHARFALVASGAVTPEKIEILRCDQYQGLEVAIRDYLARAGVASVGRACLAVASPIHGDRIEMTNNPWRFSVSDIKARFGWPAFKVINDFTAMALGVLHVPDNQRVPVCGGPGESNRPRLVIGPGTGLGVAALVPLQGGWVPLASQGGHVDFAPVDDTEMAILRSLQRRFGRVSVERILCGPGLMNLYRSHAEVAGADVRFSDPKDVTAAALAGTDALAHRVLSHFCEILGRVTGDAALMLGSLGGVYLCGGVLPHFIDFLKHSRFQAGFEDKGRMTDLMRATPVQLVTEPHTGLLGAAAALDNPQVA
ncbi:MAG: glucokinase [Oleiphilaceae bacterium]|nr:glucokinase [Oleiphilaceae bacterium]